MIEMATSQCLTNLFDVGNVSLLATSQLQYFEPEAQLIRQVIIPQLLFTCYGIITSYSALLIVSTLPGDLDLLTQDISFVVWRPRGQGLYDLVGQNDFVLSGPRIRRGLIDNSTGLTLIPDNLEYFRLIDESPQKEHISFQPGDVLGWNVNQKMFTNRRPISLVYRKADAGDTQGVFDIFSVLYNHTFIQPPCLASECDSGARNLSSIIPYISVQYSELSIGNEITF